MFLEIAVVRLGRLAVSSRHLAARSAARRARRASSSTPDTLSLAALASAKRAGSTETVTAFFRELALAVTAHLCAMNTQS